jgi:hypothetical protein
MIMCNNGCLRSADVEFVWQLLFYQPNIKLSRWHEKVFGCRSRWVREIGIVCLTHKLLVTLFRYPEMGESPEGPELMAITS